MDVKSLKAKIKSKQIPNYLIFSGDEWKVQEIYIKQIAKVTGLKTQRIDSLLHIYNALRNKNFLQERIIYIVRDDKDLMQNEKLQQQIEDDLLRDNILIHLVTSVDKRTKFYKRYKASICDFERLSDAMLYKYIQKELKLSKRNTERLIDICESDYGRILLEIDKLYCFMQYAVEHGKAVSHDECFVGLIEDGTIYEPPYDAIFDLVDAILARNVNKAFDLLQQSYAVGEATMVMLTVLYNNMKALLQVQTYTGDNITKGTGLNYYTIKNVKKHVGKYSESDLNYIVKLIHKVTNGIKTGKDYVNIGSSGECKEFVYEEDEDEN